MYRQIPGGGFVYDSLNFFHTQQRNNNSVNNIKKRLFGHDVSDSTQ